jgi:hypothetical protein
LHIPSELGGVRLLISFFPTTFVLIDPNKPFCPHRYTPNGAYFWSHFCDNLETQASGGAHVSEDNRRNFIGIRWLRSRTGLVVIGFLVIIAFFLVPEHIAHVFGILPYALLLICPLLHLFMHGGHGEHAGHAEHQAQPLEVKNP